MIICVYSIPWWSGMEWRLFKCLEGGSTFMVPVVRLSLHHSGWIWHVQNTFVTWPPVKWVSMASMLVCSNTAWLHTSCNYICTNNHGAAGIESWPYFGESRPQWSPNNIWDEGEVNLMCMDTDKALKLPCTRICMDCGSPAKECYSTHDCSGSHVWGLANADIVISCSIKESGLGWSATK